MSIDPRGAQERRMILENQKTIMTALLSLTKNNQPVANQLYYDIAKTHAYLGEKTT